MCIACEIKSLGLVHAIQLVSNDDPAAVTLLLKLHRALPGDQAFVAFCLAVKRLGLTGPELVTLRSEKGSDCELLCHIYEQSTKDSDPVNKAVSQLVIALTRRQVTW